MGRLLAISDIHGCLSKLENLLEKIELTKEDKLIILGDNIDRGEDSVGTVFKIMELKEKGYDIITLMGNHEEMFIELLHSFKDVKGVLSGHCRETVIHNGTLSTFLDYGSLDDSDKEKFLNEIKSYKDYYQYGDFVFVHAGVRENIPIEFQDKDDMLWIREGFVDKESHGLPFTVVFGHTPTITLNDIESYDIWRKNDKIGIDCGASFGGKLACLDVLNDIEYYEGE